MKRSIVILMLAVFVAALPTLASAEVLTHKEGGVDITVPDTWKSSQEGEALTITAPNGEMSIVFVMMGSDEADKAFDAIDKDVEKAVGPIVWTNEGKAAETKINEMPTLEWNGTAKEGKLQVSCLAIDTPASKVMGLYYFATAEAEKKYEADLVTIVQGMKPAAAAAAPAPKEGEGEGEGEGGEGK